MRREVLHLPDCPLVERMLAAVRAVTSEPVTLREIATEADLVPALPCRLYRGELNELGRFLSQRRHQSSLRQI